ncbi:carboxypeptidase regulatory-like domain-containing protein [candidate division KSB1 bacterium]|nr:carboxypeptidase regulatory-like domain-containing protein [candidate division KSB1 bacterium]
MASLLVTFTCWKRQQHDILAPETPRYQLSGTVCDIDSDEALASTELELEALRLLYDSAFSDTVVVTDSLGRFSFLSLVPGEYRIRIKRSNYVVFDKTVLLFNSDRTMKLVLPKPLITKRDYHRSDANVPQFEGFCWRFANLFAGVSWFGETRRRVFLGNFASGFSAIGQNSFPYENPKFYGLTYLNVYWTCDSTRMHSLSPSTGKIEGTTPVAYELSDLTTDGTHLWASTRSNIILQFGQHPSLFRGKFLVPAEKLGGIAWDGRHLWISDFLDNLIFHLDDGMKIITTYKPIYVDEFNREQPVKNIAYLAFDFNGNLWAGDGKLIYEFGYEGISSAK